MRQGTVETQSVAALLVGTRAIGEVDLADYDAIFLVGGQSPMVTMIDDPALHRFVARAREAGKIVALVCHGACVLLKTRLSNGDLSFKGRTWTSFANSEDASADSFVGRNAQPFWIEDEAKAPPETNFIVQSRFKAFALRDGNLITGRQQFSGGGRGRTCGRGYGSLRGPAVFLGGTCCGFAQLPAQFRLGGGQPLSGVQTRC